MACKAIHPTWHINCVAPNEQLGEDHMKNSMILALGIGLFGLGACSFASAPSLSADFEPVESVEDLGLEMCSQLDLDVSDEWAENVGLLNLDLQATPQEPPLGPAKLFYPLAATNAVPLIVFFNGGNVEGARYHWLAAQLAEKGYATLISDDVATNPITGYLWVAAATTELKRQIAAGVSLPIGFEEEDRVIFAGHSLGGVVAGCLGSREDCRFSSAIQTGVRADASILIGVEFQDQDPQPDSEIPFTTPALFVSGSADGLARSSEVEKTVSRIKTSQLLQRVEVEGMNHFQVTQCVNEETDRWQGDGKPTVSKQEAQQQTLSAILKFLGE